jgi:hypothetical protein
MHTTDVLENLIFFFFFIFIILDTERHGATWHWQSSLSFLSLSFIICGRELLRDVSQLSVEVLRMVTGTW